MRIADTEIADVKLVEPDVFGDDRGFFMETWRRDVFADAGIEGPWLQDNHSRSVKYVLRGIHYQIQQPQGKLVRATRGGIFDVAVDLRRSSPTFKQWAGRELTEDNKAMLWVPPGFGHAFLALSDETEIQYKCTDYYAPEHDRTIVWNDPDLAIDWPLPEGEQPLLSAKDGAGYLLSAADLYA
ncbi:MAG: dTDP-4-dehydrorhamnose 3,5-epimerase [Pseudomonadota bacterium]